MSLRYGGRTMNDKVMSVLRAMQVNEITEYHIYSALAEKLKGENAKVMALIAEAERGHAYVWSKYTQTEPEPNKLKVLYFRFIAKLFGVTFVLNLMEKGEQSAQWIYAEIEKEIPEASKIRQDEEEHEESLIAMIDDERLKYTGSIVLGLNDALVELTGALAGFTFALGNCRTIGMAGFITGSAATFSMAASEYLSKKNDSSEQHPLKAAVVTGGTYLAVVIFLLLPYFVCSSPLLALALCLGTAALIIWTFTFYVSTVYKKLFWPEFLEMLCISFGVAVFSFCIGWIAQKFLGIEV